MGGRGGHIWGILGCSQQVRGAHLLDKLAESVAGAGEVVGADAVRGIEQQVNVHGATWLNADAPLLAVTCSQGSEGRWLPPTNLESLSLAPRPFLETRGSPLS